MTEFRSSDASALLPTLMKAVLNGDEVGSRAGRVKEILHPHIVLAMPWRREILTLGRRASLPAQIAETMWLLAGRDDVEWLGRYLPRAADFSDDGKVWRGAYGRRLRRWDGARLSEGTFDQLAWVVDLLRKDHATRRAVMVIYDPSIDSADGKDIPCNDLIQFQSRLGKLHAHVFIRSNDLMWGWSGINAFEWSALLEIVAGLLGLEVGELHFSISNLHLYDRHWARAERLAEAGVVVPVRESPRFNRGSGNLAEFDELVHDWFQIEAMIRGKVSGFESSISVFPEPMLRSWLQVIAWWWTKDEAFLKPLEGTTLHTAAMYTPQKDTVVQALPTVPEIPHEMQTPIGVTDPFLEFVINLHKEKSAVYGDSWKRRGEAGIMSNIARKVDRLGQGGAGDTAADTVIDLLVYLVLYSLWLKDPRGDQDAQVAEKLRSHVPPDATKDLQRQLAWLKESFAWLETDESRHGVGSRSHTVDAMIVVAATVARRLWEDEKWHAGNATRSWNPDA